jgi:hypothetical protein
MSDRVPGPVLFALCAEFLIGGGVLRWVGAPGADVLWAVATGLALVPAVSWAWSDLRAGKFSAYPPAALALVGTAVLGEFLGGAVIGVLLVGGHALARSTKDAFVRRPKSLGVSGPSTPAVRRDSHGHW